MHIHLKVKYILFAYMPDLMFAIFEFELNNIH